MPGQLLTVEHLFPEAIGGRIKARILCQSCNSRLGQYIDAPFLKQKSIELVRAVHRLAGRNGKVPQPFSDIYSYDTPKGTLKFRLDENFLPRIIPQAPRIWIDENQSIGLEISMDEQDRRCLPIIIKTVFNRFFVNEGRACSQIIGSDFGKEPTLEHQQDVPLNDGLAHRAHIFGYSGICQLFDRYSIAGGIKHDSASSIVIVRRCV